MDKLSIEGGARLEGEVRASGAKNAALPILCASLLTAEPLVLTHVPQLNDVRTMRTLLSQMGVGIEERSPGEVVLEASRIEWPLAPYELVKTMRASILVLGPLLARRGHARVSLPGGCAIGVRPIDQHLAGLEALGARVALDHGYVDVAAPGVGILSTCTPSGYCYRSGTSMASPLVAGVAALLRQQNPARSQWSVENILETTAFDTDAPGVDAASGWGRIDVAAALDPTHYTKVPRPVRLPSGSFTSAGSSQGVIVAGTVSSSAWTRSGWRRAKVKVVSAPIDSPPTMALSMFNASITAAMSSAIASGVKSAGSVTGLESPCPRWSKMTMRYRSARAASWRRTPCRLPDRPWAKTRGGPSPKVSATISSPSEGILRRLLIFEFGSLACRKRLRPASR